MRSDEVYLRHILDAIERIEGYISGSASGRVEQARARLFVVGSRVVGQQSARREFERSRRPIEAGARFSFQLV